MTEFNFDPKATYLTFTEEVEIVIPAPPKKNCTCTKVMNVVCSLLGVVFVVNTIYSWMRSKPD